MRTRTFKDVTDCDPKSASKLEEERCLGYKSDKRIMVDKDTFNEKVTNPEEVEEIITKKCSNAFCTDEETVLKVIEFEEKCYEYEYTRSCEYCCEVDPPTDDEFDNIPCIPDGLCRTGFKTITKKSECEDVDHKDNFRVRCSDLEVKTLCQCPSDIDIDHENCVDVETSGECEFNNQSSQWVRLVKSCIIPGYHPCDKTESCDPNDCVPGEAKTNCCEKLDIQKVPGMGDKCIQTTKKCYDKDGKEVYGEVACPNCKEDICKLIRECEKDELDICSDKMGGELYCDARMPECLVNGGKNQTRVCTLGVKPEDLCKYKKNCACSNFKCTETSFAIEGITKDVLDGLQFRTNDLHETYGPDLNFFIGGASPSAHTTEGCFHHYRSENGEGIDLVYSFDDLENKCGITIPKDNKLNVTVWVDDAGHKSEKIASATPFANVSFRI